MKTMKTFLFCLSILALVSCRNDRNTMDENRGNDLNRNDNTMTDRTYNENAPELNANTDRSGNDYYTQMYRDLDMTPEQIQRFERDNPNFRDTGNTRDTNIDNSLRGILDENQYRKYETWRDRQINNTRNDVNSNNNTNTNNRTNNQDDVY